MKFTEFVEWYISKLATDYKVPAPKYRISVLPLEVGARYIYTYPGILISHDFERLYSKYPELVEPVLKFLIAREFYYHIRNQEAILKLTPKPFRYVFESINAEEFAEAQLKPFGYTKEKIEELYKELRRLRITG